MTTVCVRSDNYVHIPLKLSHCKAWPTRAGPANCPCGCSRNRRNYRYGPTSPPVPPRTFRRHHNSRSVVYRTDPATFWWPRHFADLCSRTKSRSLWCSCPAGFHLSKLSRSRWNRRPSRTWWVFCRRGVRTIWFSPFASGIVSGVSTRISHPYGQIRV